MSSSTENLETPSNNTHTPHPRPKVRCDFLRNKLLWIGFLLVVVIVLATCLGVIAAQKRRQEDEVPRLSKETGFAKGYFFNHKLAFKEEDLKKMSGEMDFCDFFWDFLCPRTSYIGNDFITETDKLIQKDVINKLHGIPMTETLYQAYFVVDDESKFPLVNERVKVFTEEEQRNFEENFLGILGEKEFLVKPCHATNKRGILKMTQRKWDEENWTPQKVTNWIKRNILQANLHYDLRGRLNQYEKTRPGFLIEPIYWRSGDSQERPYEFKLHVVWGKAVYGLVHDDDPFKIDFWGYPDAGELKVVCEKKDKKLCNFLEGSLRAEWDDLKTYSEAIASMWGFDYIRVDWFFSGPDGLKFNESEHTSLWCKHKLQWAVKKQMKMLYDGYIKKDYTPVKIDMKTLKREPLNEEL